jgi:hypothetical protein
LQLPGYSLFADACSDRGSLVAIYGNPGISDNRQTVTFP